MLVVFNDSKEVLELALSCGFRELTNSVASGRDWDDARRRDGVDEEVYERNIEL